MKYLLTIMTLYLLLSIKSILLYTTIIAILVWNPMNFFKTEKEKQT